MTVFKHQYQSGLALLGKLTSWFIPKGVQNQTNEHLRYQSVIALSLVIGSSGFPFIFVFLMMGYPYLSIVVLWSFLFFYLIPWICKWGVSVQIGSHLVALNYYQCHFFLALLFGGVSAPNLMWFVALPLISILTGGIRHGLIWGGITILSIMTLYGGEYLGYFEFQKNFTNDEILFVHSAGSIGLTFAVLGSAIAYEVLKNLALEERKKVEQQLVEANQKAETLLHNILPVPIASRLKAGEKTIADEHQNVSVLFFDVVGFTAMSERMSPSELVHLLNDLFSTMDQIVERYNLLKIKTIGDAYMVVAGVPVVQADHAQRLTTCALDMLNQFQLWKLQAYRRYNESLEIRMGIHSGSLVAGVIGLSNFAYDVWGDTVNTAARMESHGLANRIQISHNTYQLIRHNTHFCFDSRGQIEVKGKGLMDVYLVKSAL